jgi:hypothetical protein
VAIEHEHRLSRARLRALGLERVLVLERGNVELGLPAGWTVEPDPAGHLKLKDPTDSCLLELSYFVLPPGLTGLPTVSERVALGLGEGVSISDRGPIVAGERAGYDLAWTRYEFDSEDTKSGERRVARARFLLAANAGYQAMLTFSYWAEDTEWALPLWERMMESLRLGDGVPLETPRDHWGLRDETTGP